MIENDVPMSKYVITKQLTKAIEEYPDAKHQPHVMVAKRRAEAGKRDGTKAGETVPHIIAAAERRDAGRNAAARVAVPVVRVWPSARITRRKSWRWD